MEKRSDDTKIAYVASEKLLSMAGVKVSLIDVYMKASEFLQS